MVLLLTLVGLANAGSGSPPWMEPWPACDSGRVAALTRRPQGFVFLVNASNGDTHTVSLVCTDDSGRVQWTRPFDTEKNLVGTGLQALGRGGHVICGSSAERLGKSDFWLAGLSPEGEVLWQRAWGGAGSQALNAVAEDSARNLVLAGWAQNEKREDADLYLAKTDGLGNLIWTRQIGGPDEERLAAVCLMQKGGIIAAGQRAANDNQTLILLLRTDAQGQVLWQRTYKLDDEAHVADVCATSDGGALVVSSYPSPWWEPGACAAHALKVDADGEPLWEKRYYLGPRCCDEFRVREESEGFMIAAFAIGCDTTRRGLQVVQLDRLGESLWRTFYSGSGYNRWVKEWGNWFSNTADPLEMGLRILFGEPVGEFRLAVRGPRLLGKHKDKWATLITFELPRQSPVQLVLSDIHGRKVETLLDVNCAPGRQSLWWDATDQPEGIYVVRLETSEGTLTEKFVVMK
jgi:hypothetical protein